MKSKVYIIKWSLKAIAVLILLHGNTRVLAQQSKLGARLQAMTTAESKPGLIRFNNIPDLKASNIFTTYKDAFGLGKNDKMINYRAETDQLGFTTYRYQQYYNNLPVEFGTVIVNEKDGRLQTMVGNCLNDIKVNTTPLLSESTALQLALNNINAHVYSWQVPGNEAMIKEVRNDPQATTYPKGNLMIINENIISNDGKFHLVYKFHIDAVEPSSGNDIYVDARNGNIIQKFNTMCSADVTGTAVTQMSGTRSIKTEKVITGPFTSYYRLTETGRGGGIQTLNMNHRQDFNNVTYFTDDDNYWNNVNANLDQFATDAHWAGEMTYDYYLSRHARNSWNNAGALIRLYVHYGNQVNNGFFTGTFDVIELGDGNNINYPNLSLDFVGHEFTHGVTKYTCNLVYQGESGAINEAFSDIFGTDIEFNTKAGNYLMFEDTWKAAGGFDRSMSNPKSGSPPQPDTYKKTNWTPATPPYNNGNDQGGVHTNSGVMNKWFYLLSEGGGGKNDKGDKYNVKGITRDKAIKIAYRTLTTKINANAQFQQVRDGSIAAAQDLYPGVCSNEVVQTKNAWYAVGVGDPSIQIDSSKVDKTSCNQDNGRIYVRVKGVDPPGPTYLWSNGQTTQEVNNLAEGTYTVTITDPTTGCKVDTIFKVEENVNFSTSIGKIDITTCGANDGFATIGIAGTNGTPDILWSNGGTTNSINNLSKGWYFVTVTDTSTHCHKKDSIEIKEPGPQVTISGGGNRTYCKGKPAPTITLTAVVQFCFLCSYHWSNGATGSSISVSSGGNYSVTVTNLGGCTGTASTSVSIWERDCDNQHQWEIPVVNASDPNEMDGPIGYGPPKYVARSVDQPYTIHFENSPDFATAPAQKVIINAPFDPKVDMFTLRLGDFGFGKYIFNVPPNTAFYNTRLDLTDSLNIDVDVTAGIDVANNKAFWIFQTIDPATGVEPTDPLVGFLPVDDSLTGIGEGFVSFTQRAKGNTVTGDTIHAQASIIFDINAPLPTNTWANVIDAVPPVTQVTPLPASIDSSWIVITITGSDDAGGSGLKTYSLYAAADNGTYAKIGDYDPDSAIIFTGTPGTTYRFFSLGTDNVGNVEAMKNAPEATIHFNLYRPGIKGHLTYDNSLNTPMNNVHVYLTNSMGFDVDSTFTNSAGYYQLFPFLPGKYIIHASTSKAWGGVNAVDALVILRQFAGLDTLSALRRKAADVNASGNVNAIDALLTAKRFANIDSSFISGDWLYQRDTVTFTDSTVYYDSKWICYGDVNGSYTPPGTKSEPSARLLTEGQLNVNPGEEILLPVSLKEDHLLGAVSLVLSYPTDLVEVTGVVAGNNQGNIVYSARNGIIRIAWYDITPMKAGEGNPLIYLKLKALKLTSTMFVSFGLGDESCLAGPDKMIINPANLLIPKLKIDVPQNFELVSNHPNPFSVQTEIGYSLPEPGLVKLTVLNALGEQVALLVNEEKSEGTYTTIFNGSGLSEGVYFCKFEVETQNTNYVQAMKMVLIH